MLQSIMVMYTDDELSLIDKPLDMMTPEESRKLHHMMISANGRHQLMDWLNNHDPAVRSASYNAKVLGCTYPEDELMLKYLILYHATKGCKQHELPSNFLQDGQ